MLHHLFVYFTSLSSPTSKKIITRNHDLFVVLFMRIEREREVEEGKKRKSERPIRDLNP